jgi:hypothetical protein
MLLGRRVPSGRNSWSCVVGDDVKLHVMLTLFIISLSGSLISGDESKNGAASSLATQTQQLDANKYDKNAQHQSDDWHHKDAGNYNHIR